MTTITYRGSTRTSPSVGLADRYQTQLLSYVGKLANRWHQWQAEREIESMPLDMRKDFGWPTADIDERRKEMQ